MAEYRIYVVGGHGNIMSRIDIECADDNAAINIAKKHIDCHEIEIWQRDRLVAKFDRKTK